MADLLGVCFWIVAVQVCVFAASAVLLGVSVLEVMFA